MITITQYTVKQRYCDRCGIPEDSFPSSVTIDGKIVRMVHRDIKTEGSLTTITNTYAYDGF